MLNQESREAKTKENRRGGSKNGSRELLWKAFQFAFRVYSFAGGQDDRADKLTRELAQEIQTDPNQQTYRYAHKADAYGAFKQWV